VLLALLLLVLCHGVLILLAGFPQLRGRAEQPLPCFLLPVSLLKYSVSLMAACKFSY
jgi:hypothetical protein